MLRTRLSSSTTQLHVSSKAVREKKSFSFSDGTEEIFCRGKAWKRWNILCKLCVFGCSTHAHVYTSSRSASWLVHVCELYWSFIAEIIFSPPGRLLEDFHLFTYSCITNWPDSLSLVLINSKPIARRFNSWEMFPRKLFLFLPSVIFIIGKKISLI